MHDKDLEKVKHDIKTDPDMFLYRALAKFEDKNVEDPVTLALLSIALSLRNMEALIQKLVSDQAAMKKDIEEIRLRRVSNKR